MESRFGHAPGIVGVLFLMVWLLIIIGWSVLSVYAVLALGRIARAQQEIVRALDQLAVRLQSAQTDRDPGTIEGS